ncbi:DUF2334 domain-containing protein [Nocardia sp. NPDC005978]|uniref:DUF2334 domain-containing protein n=1 Tax=Nocardia sp. NPDC005978 TaxID=3156725 RepID=UPI0033A6C380
MGRVSPSAFGVDRFHVSVHDVAPEWAAETAEIFDALTPLVGSRVSAGVVPCWGGRPLRPGDEQLVAGRAQEVLLHGWTHRRERGRGPVSLLTGGADEFAGLGADAAAARLRAGRDALSERLGTPVEGFLPPAYRLGSVGTETLAAVGLRYRVGWASAADVHGRTVRLATRIWDVSPLAALSRAAAAVGHLADLRPGAVPTITIHPLDVRRGFLPHALAAVRAQLALGRTPALIRELIDRAQTR